MATNLNDIIRVAARHAWAGVDDIINVYHFRVAIVPTPLSDDLLRADLATKLSTTYDDIQANMSNQVDALDITSYNVTQDYPIGVTGWTAPYVGGTGTGESLPQGCGPLVKWLTAVKRTQGRTYMPPVMEGNQDGGSLTLGTVTQYLTFAANLLAGTAGPNGYGFQLIVYKRSLGVAVTITSAAVSGLIAYQRRRKLGVGG